MSTYYEARQIVIRKGYYVPPKTVTVYNTYEVQYSPVHHYIPVETRPEVQSDIRRSLKSKFIDTEVIKRFASW